MTLPEVKQRAGLYQWQRGVVQWNFMCVGFVCVRASRRAVLQIASVPNYTVLMKACTPGGPTEDRLGTSPVPLKRGESVTTLSNIHTHANTHTQQNTHAPLKTDEDREREGSS